MVMFHSLYSSLIVINRRQKSEYTFLLTLNFNCAKPRLLNVLIKIVLKIISPKVRIHLHIYDEFYTSLYKVTLIAIENYYRLVILIKRTPILTCRHLMFFKTKVTR
jgi:hypothetical protein